MCSVGYYADLAMLQLLSGKDFRNRVMTLAQLVTPDTSELRSWLCVTTATNAWYYSQTYTLLARTRIKFKA
jgi:hypothetical protein